MSVWSDQAAGFLDISQNSSSEVWKYFLKNRHTEIFFCRLLLSNGKIPQLITALEKN